jgi:hypothetical protein
MTAAATDADAELPTSSVDKPVDDIGIEADFPIIITSISIMPKIETLDIQQ